LARPNYRLIFTITFVAIIVLFAITIIGLGYLSATSQSIGTFAPIGDPINVKHKTSGN
jgi:hypothetical protein